jgi:hypothetical protein
MYLSLCLRDSLVVILSVLISSRWFFTPEGDCYSGVGEYEHGDGEEVLENHQRQTVTQIYFCRWPSKLKNVNYTKGIVATRITIGNDLEY